MNFLSSCRLSQGIFYTKIMKQTLSAQQQKYLLSIRGGLMGSPEISLGKLLPLLEQMFADERELGEAVVCRLRIQHAKFEPDQEAHNFNAEDSGSSELFNWYA
jgi:hypothetical protein